MKKTSPLHFGLGGALTAAAQSLKSQDTQSKIDMIKNNPIFGTRGASNPAAVAGGVGMVDPGVAGANQYPGGFNATSRGAADFLAGGDEGARNRSVYDLNSSPYSPSKFNSQMIKNTLI